MGSSILFGGIESLGGTPPPSEKKPVAGNSGDDVVLQSLIQRDLKRRQARNRLGSFGTPDSAQKTLLGS